MGTVLVSSTISSVRDTLVDANGVTWTDSELEGYYNEALRALVMLKPDAYVVDGPVALVAGTRQNLPAGATAIFDIEFNTVSKARANMVDKELLDEANRFWRAATGETDVQHWCADPRERTAFVVTPPNDGDGSVVAVYGAVPPEVGMSTGTSSAIPIGDQYEPALIQYILHRAYAKQTKRFDQAKSQAALQQFMTLLGIGSKGQAAVAPREVNSPGEA